MYTGFMEQIGVSRFLDILLNHNEFIILEGNIKINKKICTYNNMGTK
jgi:hypothetical protein